MTASELIKNIRMQTGLQQEDFARAIHVSYGTVNRWENNKSTPNQLAKAMLTDYCQNRAQTKH